VVDDPGSDPDDIVITIRGSRVFLKAPEHDEATRVPDDFLVAIGVARAFYDPKFRRLLLALARQVIDDGEIEGITPNYGHERPH
jgi:hypothetical protein